jgi:Derlin-2/3
MPFAQPANNQGGVGVPQGPDQWFKALPIITQYWFGATMLVTLSVNFQILSGYQVMWSWEGIKTRFELWRILTPFCYAGPFEFSTLIGCYMQVQFSKQYEAGGPFNTGAGGGTADYAFCMLFGTVMMLLSYPFLGGILGLPPVFCRNLSYYVLYIWSKRNPTANANIWGFPIKAVYLPFAYLAMTVFMGNSYMDMLHGIAIGHLYYFMVDVIPVVYGRDILKTPMFLINYFGVGEYRPPEVGGGGGGLQAAGGAGGPARAPPAPRAGGHVWGVGGQRLGT